jgi:low affinity Fe/Cu permease
MDPYRAAPFSRFARATAHATGHPAALRVAGRVLVGGAGTGPRLGFCDTRQQVMNTGTTVVTFLMVFLIQNTQNRDSAAVQLKLDELIRAVQGAHNALLDLEELTDGDLGRLKGRYRELARHARADLARGLLDVGVPAMPREGAAPTGDG